jgi:hypothetical protein
VTLLRATTTPLAALGFISLTQVPYTGVGDLFFTIFFILALFVVSASIAYVVTYGNITERAKALVFGTPVLYADETMTPGERAQYAQSTMVLSGEFDPRVPALNNRPVAPTYFSNVPKAIENTAAILSMNNHDDAIADEIAQGLTNVSRAIKDHKLGITTTTATDTTAISQSFQALEARIEVAARAREVVIGQDGVHLIATAADGNDDNALRILEQVIEVAREWQPTHEGTWLSISGNKVREILFSTYLSMVPAFVRWIAHGEGKKVFSLIRILNHQGHSVSDFLRATVHELDAVYRFRTERMGHADLTVLDATKTWKRVTLEKVIAAIVSALDESYASPYIAGKLALSKALQASEEDAKSDDNKLMLRDVIGR